MIGIPGSNGMQRGDCFPARLPLDHRPASRLVPIV